MFYFTINAFPIGQATIPITPLLLCPSAYFLYRRFAVMNTLDRYPVHLNNTVEQIRTSIDQGVFHRNTASNDHPEWFIKRRANNEFMQDLSEFFSVGIWNATYVVNNCYGTVYRSYSIPLRVKEAKKLRRIIKHHRLDMLEVPKKYCCSYRKNSNFNICFNYGYFVLAKHYGTSTTTIYSCWNKNLKTLSKNRAKKLAAQLITFFKHSGALDFHPGNYYMEKDKFIYFDTEPMSLTLISYLFSIFAPLKIVKFNCENARLGFNEINKNLAKPFVKEIKRIETQELMILAHRICFITLALLHLISGF